MQSVSSRIWTRVADDNHYTTTRSYNNQQKKRTDRIVDFAVPKHHTVKLKECEKKDNYLDLAK